MTHEEQSQLINDYLACDSKIKQLEKLRDSMKEKIVALGEGSHSTDLGTATVSLQERRTLSTTKIKEAFSEEMLKDFYTTSSSIVVRVTKF